MQPVIPVSAQESTKPIMYYAIGDVHGRYDLLDKLLERIAIDAQGKNFQVVFLGDYIDRGSQSRQVIDRLVKLKGQNPKAFVFLLGNHDFMLREIVEAEITPDLVVQFNMMADSKNGFLQTLKSYGVDVDLNNYDPVSIIKNLKHLFPIEHLEFLRHAQIYHDTTHVFFSHAGIEFNVPLTSQKEEVLLWGHPAMFLHGANHEKWIVHGHWGNRGREVCGKRICVDSGAVWTNVLTACVIEQDQVRFLSTSPGTAPREQKDSPPCPAPSRPA